MKSTDLFILYGILNAKFDLMRIIIRLIYYIIIYYLLIFLKVMSTLFGHTLMLGNQYLYLLKLKRLVAYFIRIIIYCFKIKTDCFILRL